MENKIFDLILDQDEISWQSIIYDLVKTEGMDPWDIDVSSLSRKYLDVLKKLKEMDFRISGKMVLASAILLKIKSNRLLSKDLAALDNMFAGNDDEDEMQEVEGDNKKQRINIDGNSLIPKTPQPRKRKVSVYDLIEALQKALEIKRRQRRIVFAPEVKLPENVVDLTQMMGDVFGTIEKYFAADTDKKLYFHELVPQETRQAKIYTFVPLLHLVNQRKVDLLQEEHFGDIEIALAIAKAETEDKVDEELRAETAIDEEIGTKI